jgi:putative peptidoglycan lipid II flippase
MAAVTAPVRESETGGVGGRIARAAFILLGGFVASRLVGLLREVVVYGRFGASGELDVYFAAFRIPDLIFNLVAGGALGSALVPVFASYRAAGPPGRAARLATNVFNVVGMVAALGAVLGIVFAPALVPFLGPGFSAGQQASLVLLVRILLLQPVLFGLGEVVTRYLNVYGHFATPALAPVVYNLCIIGAALWLTPALGTAGLAVGVVLGALAYLLVQVPAAHTLGFRWGAPWGAGFDPAEPGLRQIVLLMLPRLVSQGAVQLSFFFTTRLASFLPPGRLAALTLGWTLMMLPLGILAMSTANAAFPVLAEQAATGQQRALAATVRRTLGTVLFLMVPSAVGLLLLGLPLVQTVFVRGEFGAESAALTATALGVYALGLPGHGAIEVLARAFFARQDTRTPVILGVSGMALNVLLASLLVGPAGLVGIALALSVSATLEALALFGVLAARLPGLLTLGLVASAGRTALAGLVMGLATLGAMALARGALSPLWELLAGAAVAGLAYGGAALALRAPELMEVLGALRRRRRRV